MVDALEQLAQTEIAIQLGKDEILLDVGEFASQQCVEGSYDLIDPAR
ncbi:MAG: hypothetical protein PHS77_07295 [Gallionellaceae bacterium]|nr:hypothetical protein [Gallionellaceae bacterium]